MNGVGNILLEKEILLESGTNELEVLVFRLGAYTFGINVAKVREVLPSQQVTRIPKSHSSVMGAFRLRDTVVPCVSLRKHLGVKQGEGDESRVFILTDFSHQQTAFEVDAVERIHRLSWKQVLPFPSLSATTETPVTAVAHVDGRMILMLDFEMIADQVTEQKYRATAVDNPHGLPREQLKILLADDSPTIRQAVTTMLHESGYSNLEVFENGDETWKWIEKRLAESPEGEVADLLISDVEMPQVDGFHLTKRVKENPRLARMPVLLYSSVISSDNQKKGEAVGADAQIAKPDLHKIVGLADELIAKVGGKTTASFASSEPTNNETQPADANEESEESKSAHMEIPKTENKQEAKEATPPTPLLMVTFRQELAERAAHLRTLLTKIEAGEKTDDLANDMMRTMHNIKSASMVLPVKEVSSTTHLLETRLELWRDNHSDWPNEIVLDYIEWLEALSESNVDFSTTLEHATDLKRRLSELLEPSVA